MREIERRIRALEARQMPHRPLPDEADLSPPEVFYEVACAAGIDAPKPSSGQTTLEYLADLAKREPDSMVVMYNYMIGYPPS